MACEETFLNSPVTKTETFKQGFPVDLSGNRGYVDDTSKFGHELRQGIFNTRSSADKAIGSAFGRYQTGEYRGSSNPFQIKYLNRVGQ